MKAAKGPVPGGQGEQVVEFGFIPKQVITDLQDIGTWRVSVAMEPKM